jgi:hypothetical protein
LGNFGIALATVQIERISVQIDRHARRAAQVGGVNRPEMDRAHL